MRRSKEKGLTYNEKQGLTYIKHTPKFLQNLSQKSPREPTIDAKKPVDEEFGKDWKEEEEEQTLIRQLLEEEKKATLQKEEVMRELAKDGLAEWDAEQAELNQDTTKKRSPEPEPDLVSLPEKIVFQQPKRLKVETDPKAKLQALISQN